MRRVPIKDIKPNPNNPRSITQEQLDKLIESIKAFPEMLEQRPIVVDETMTTLGGNMRLKACQLAGIDKVPITIAKGWTEEQKKEFIIKDNLGYGHWDFEAHAEGWDQDQLAAWGLEVQIGSIKVEGIEEEVEDLDLVYEPAKELHIQQQYLVVVFETPEEYQEAKKQLDLKTVRTTNHEKQDLNETGTETVVTWKRIKGQ